MEGKITTKEKGGEMEERKRIAENLTLPDIIDTIFLEGDLNRNEWKIIKDESDIMRNVGQQREFKDAFAEYANCQKKEDDKSKKAAGAKIAAVLRNEIENFLFRFSKELMRKYDERLREREDEIPASERNLIIENIVKFGADKKEYGRKDFSEKLRLYFEFGKAANAALDELIKKLRDSETHLETTKHFGFKKKVDFEDIDLKELKEQRNKRSLKAINLAERAHYIGLLLDSDKKVNRENAAKTFQKLGVDINDLIDAEGVVIKERCLEHLRKVDEERAALQRDVSADPKYPEFQSIITISIWKGEYDGVKGGRAKVMNYLFDVAGGKPADRLINNILILKDAVHYAPPYHSTMDLMDQLFVLYDRTTDYLNNLKDEEGLSADVAATKKAYNEIREFLKEKTSADKVKQLLDKDEMTPQEKKNLIRAVELLWNEFTKENYEEIEEIMKQFHEPRTKQEVEQEIKRLEKELEDVWYKARLLRIPKDARQSNFGVMSELRKARLLFNEKEMLVDLKEIMPEKIVSPGAEYKLELLNKISGKEISDEEYEEGMKKVKPLEQMREEANTYFLRYQTASLMMKSNEDKMLSLEPYVVFSVSKEGKEMILVPSTADKKINRGKIAKKISSLESEIFELESKRKEAGKLNENENKALDNARNELSGLEIKLRKSGKNKRRIQEKVQEILDKRVVLQKLSDHFLNEYESLLDKIKKERGGDYD